MKLVTAAQMAALEGAAVDAGISLDELMEQAGLAVAQEAWMALGVVAGRRVLVLVGAGNNGGDGLVAARHLAEWEADVAVYMLTARDGDLRVEQLREREVPVFVASSDDGFEILQQALDVSEMVIDALLGTGRSRPIEGALAEILTRLNAAIERPLPPKIIAVDLPTGVDADSGRADPLAVSAELTVTFGLAKVGLYTLPGSEHAGRVEVVDIGIPKDATASVALELLATAWVRERLPKRPKAANKGTFGRVLVVAGSPNYVGAARLAAEACYRAGAGLVTIACTPTVQSMLAPSIAEAIWAPLPEKDGQLMLGADAEILGQIEALGESAVYLVGPGLGQNTITQELVMETLPGLPNPCLIDADALNNLARAIHQPWFERIPGNCVLTPHPGEMARLLGCSVAEVQNDRLNVAMHAAAQWRQVVVLKGAHTVIAAPDGRGAISPYANPLLATAGTGDVLAGAIAGLLAQGMEPFEAAACGVYLHGLAADEVGEELGDRGLLASDLLPALPRAIRTVLHGKASRAAPSPFAGLGDFGALANLPGAIQ